MNFYEKNSDVLGEETSSVEELVQDTVADLYCLALRTKREQPNLDIKKIKEIIFTDFLNRVVKGETLDTELLEYPEKLKKSNSEYDLGVNHNVSRNKNEIEQNSLKRLPHNKEEDREILEFAQKQAIDGFFEEELFKHLEKTIENAKIPTLRNKLSRFSRSPKNFLQKSSTRQKFYTMTEKGTEELMVLRKRAEHLAK